jgi:hypothetical protein
MRLGPGPAFLASEGNPTGGEVAFIHPSGAADLSHIQAEGTLKSINAAMGGGGGGGEFPFSQCWDPNGGLQDPAPDPLVRGMDPDPAPDPSLFS